MADLYHILAQLCNQHQITPYRMCKDTGIQPSVMTDLKKGRRQTVKAETAGEACKLLWRYSGLSAWKGNLFCQR